MKKKWILSLVALMGLGFLLALATSAPSLQAKEAKEVPVRSLGSKDAPVTMVEYASFTCSHCADFYNTVMPELEKKYIETGKLRVIYRDYPMDGVGLKASALARCMPEDQYFGFIKVIYKNMMSWIKTPKPEETLMQYAQMAGLEAEKAKACMADTDMIDALLAVRTHADEKFGINSTPTFIFNDGKERIVGAQSIKAFSDVIDQLLAAKK